jgi:hypothetical protein
MALLRVGPPDFRARRTAGPLTLSGAAQAVASGIVAVWNWAKVALPSLTLRKRSQGRRKRGKGKRAGQR